jgi:hypothetical protein
LYDAVSRDDLECVRSLIKRQRSMLLDLNPAESESLLRVASELNNPDDMVHVLLEAGLRICEAVGSCNLKGSDDVHVAGGNIDYDEEQHVSASSLTTHFCRSFTEKKDKLYFLKAISTFLYLEISKNMYDVYHKQAKTV